MHRPNILTLIIGDRNAGKTTYLKGDKNVNVVGILEDYLKTGRRILMVDRFDNQDWQEVEIISIDKIKSFSGIARIYSSRIDELISYLEKELYNCVLVFEDATKYIDKQLDKAFENFCIESKQRNIDIFFVFHHLMAPPKDLVRICDYITLFKTYETFSDVRSKYPDPRIRDAFIQVYENIDPHYHITINKR